MSCKTNNINILGSYFDSLGHKVPSPSFILSDSELKDWSYNPLNGKWEYSYGSDSYCSGHSCSRPAWIEMAMKTMYYAVVFIPVIYCHFPWHYAADDVHKLVFSTLYAILFIAAMDGLMHRQMQKFIGGILLGAIIYALFDRQIIGLGMHMVMRLEYFIIRLLHLGWLADFMVIPRLIFLFMVPCSIMDILGRRKPSLKLSRGAHKALIQCCWMFSFAILSCGWFAIFSSEWKQLLCLVGVSILIPLCMGKKAAQMADEIA